MNEIDHHQYPSYPESKILRGDIVAAHIRSIVKSKVSSFIEKNKRSPHLAVLLSHDNPASSIYVKRKVEACMEVGIRSTVDTTPCSTTSEVISIVKRLNDDSDIDAILVQFPLHPHVDAFEVTQAIDPTKDADGFSPHNLGRLVQGDIHGLLPCTPKGIVRLLEYYQINPEGKHVVIVGRSMVVGKPLALLLSATAPYGNATVTIAHRKTENLREICLSADIIVAAAGSARLIQGSMIRDGAVIIDVGMNRIVDSSTSLTDKKSVLVGDVAFDEAITKVKAITPVPRGVGPMTVACLLENTLLCAERKRSGDNKQ